MSSNESRDGNRGERRRNRPVAPQQGTEGDLLFEEDLERIVGGASFARSTTERANSKDPCYMSITAAPETKG